MNRWLLAYWRRLAMQGALFGVLGITVGLAALATHEKRLALRLPLGPEIHVGRMSVRLPKAWAPPVIAEESSTGDLVTTEEILPGGMTGRRLAIRRARTTGMLSPLEYLLRTPYMTDADLRADSAAISGPPRLQPLEVGHWPGVMVSRSIVTQGGRRVQKQLLACSILAPAQALVIRLEGPGEPDAADEELLRQMAEALHVHGDPRKGIAEAGSSVELGGGVFTLLPDHYWKLPADPCRSSRDILADGSNGTWTAIELIPCIWLPEDDQRAFLGLLAARDSEWRSGPVKKLAAGIWQVDRIDGSGLFPTRAYCMTDGDSQAMIAVMHGGLHGEAGFDAAWQTISAGTRFNGHRELAALLENGREQVEQIIEDGAEQFLIPQAARQAWTLWDQNENADWQFWMQLEWGPKGLTVINSEKKPSTIANSAVPDKESHPVMLWHGLRDSWPDRTMIRAPIPSLARVYGGDQPSQGTHQTWDGTADLQYYRSYVDRVISVHGQTSQPLATQRWELRDGKLRNLLSGEDPIEVPEQFIPGGWLPLILGKVSDKPMVLRTESFVGVDGNATPELLTLLITPVEGGSMRCIKVSVNGTGQTMKWWYELDGSLRYIDIAGEFRAQRNDGTIPSLP
jgi:hypothetical protein